MRFISRYKNALLPGLVVVILTFTYSFYQKEHPVQNSSISNAEPEPAPELLTDDYGIEFEQFLIDTNTVKSRQTLGHILAGYDIDNYTIDLLVRQMREYFDPRNIKSGNTYISYHTPDSINKLSYFVYDISPLEYIKIELSDSIAITRGEREVTVKPLTASGIINSSLWETLSQNEINPELAIRMSEILAWEVDFYRIHAGDRFKVIYEESFVGDQSVGIGRIDAIYFSHHGRDIYGFKFEKDTVSGYFGPGGESLRKVFLAAPIKFGRISSGYSASRFHPVLKTRRPHYGTDYAAPTGTPIYAVGDGVVSESRYTSGNGNYVKIRHNSVYETQYLHMSRFAQGIRPGKRVQQGEVIGYVGMTGLATGPHVCFRFWKNGQQVNHRKEEFPSADPLDPDYYSSFFQIRDRFTQQLEAISFPEQLPV